MVKDIILTTNKNIKKYKLKNLSDVYQSKFQMSLFSQKMREFDNKIKEFLRKKNVLSP